MEAVNDHGVSEASQRVIFRTASQLEKDAELEGNMNLYNETACCVSVSFATFSVFYNCNSIKN